MPITGYVSGCLGGVAPSDPTTLWVNAVIANGGTVSAGRRTLVSNLLTSLQLHGLFTKLDRLWLHAGENTASALTDIIARSLATAVNTPTFTVDQGYDFDGLTNYLSMVTYNFVSANFTANAGHVGAYVRSALPFATECAVGGQDPVYGNITLTSNGSANWRGVLSNAIITSASNTPGFGMLTRTASNASAIYVNGSSVGSDPGTPLGTPSGIVGFIGARNSGGGVPDVLFSGQLAASCAGGALTATDAANLSTDVNTYMTAIGANVY